MNMPKYFNCPICGTKVSITAKCCPECGSDYQTGWSEEAQYIHLLPDRNDDDVTNKSGQILSFSWFKKWGLFIVLVMIAGFITVALDSFFALLALVGILILYFFLEIYPKTAYAKGKRLYKKLLQKASGNSQLANRLIELERERSPKGTRLELIQDAIDRWEKDNR